MFKNLSGQKLIVFAFDSTTNLPKTGDAANLTAYVSKDYGSVTALGDTSATEMDSTNAKGYYLFDLTQSETNADTLLFSAKSSTSNIVVIAVPATVFTAPTTGFLAPTTAGNTLDVSSGGEAGIDWGNIGNKTTSNALTGTTIATTQKVDIETIKTNPVVNGGTVTFPTNATLASTTNITAGTVTTATNVTTVNGLAANVVTAASLATDAVNEIVDQVWEETLTDHSGTSGSTAAALNAAGSAGDPWATALPGAYGAGTAGRLVGRSLPDIVAGASGGLFIAGTNAATTVTTSFTTTFTGNLTGNVGGNVTGSVGSLATQAKADVNAEVDTALADVGLTTTVTGRIDVATSTRMATYTQPTGFLAATFPATVASTTNITAASGVALTSAYDFAKGTVAMTEAYPADGAAMTPAQALYLLLSVCAEFSIAGTAITCKKLDGTTTAATYTLDDATNPTSRTRAT